MLTVENTSENAGRARQKRARLTLENGQKTAAKKMKKGVDNLINQLIGFLLFELSGYFSIKNS